MKVDIPEILWDDKIAGTSVLMLRGNLLKNMIYSKCKDFYVAIFEVNGDPIYIAQ